MTMPMTTIDDFDADLEMTILMETCKRERMARGESLTDVACNAGMSQKTICNMEHAHYAPGMVTFIKYAHALGFEVGLMRLDV